MARIEPEPKGAKYQLTTAMSLTSRMQPKMKQGGNLVLWQTKMTAVLNAPHLAGTLKQPGTRATRATAAEAEMDVEFNDAEINDRHSWALLLLASLSCLLAFEVGSFMNVQYPSADTENQPWMEQVGLHPRVYYYHNFLSEAERTHMLRLAAPHMRRSQVSGAGGVGVVDNIRTSYGMFIRRLQDPIIENIENRIAMATHLPVAHQEDIQVLRYVKGQSYRAHFDSAYDNEDSGPHQRLATFYMYLSDVEEGGETAFPEGSEWVDPAMGPKADQTFSECAKGHVAARPKAGDAVLFYSFFPNKTMDAASMHTGCPVIRGIKWGAPVWIHIDEYEPAQFSALRVARPVVPDEPGLCADLHEMCEEWAARGECTKSPVYMIGSGGEAGSCLKACKACETCKDERDFACIHRNRKQEGFLELEKEEMDWLGVPWWME
ncbi:hypothetical protein FOA52_005307 [Chlamydomonas sp. UWO 241]|nr:hypothetical protein FOA52_005307 [Chlamydomonas sp. UWO 241]